MSTSPAVRDEVGELLTAVSHGRCLDLGTGAGGSANAMLANEAVSAVVTAEPSYEWFGVSAVYDSRAVLIKGGLEEALTYGPFDFAFIDHFPLEDRNRCGSLLSFLGVETWIDDSGLVEPPSGFHQHGTCWHYTEKECVL